MLDLCSRTIEKVYYAREYAFYEMGLLFPEIMREYVGQPGQGRAPHRYGGRWGVTSDPSHSLPPHLQKKGSAGLKHLGVGYHWAVFPTPLPPKIGVLYEKTPPPYP